MIRYLAGMDISIAVGGAAVGTKKDWPERAEYVRQADKIGVASCWTAEAWGWDAVSPAAYLLAVTERMKIGTGIMQTSARAPSMTAMTAMTLADMSDNRFILGLGASGPQVVEGLIGESFDRPLARLKEVTEICQLAFAGEKLVYDGHHYVLPRPGGQGKALRLAMAANDIPIYLATLGPRSLTYTGEVAQGWVGTSFVPEAGGALIDPIRAGAESAGRDPSSIDLMAGGNVAFANDPSELIERHRDGVAFSVSAMGSPDTNFYKNAYERAGYEQDCAAIQALWLDGKRDAARARVPDEMVTRTNLFGTDDMVKARIRAYRDSGITTLRAAPLGRTTAERLDVLGRLIDLVAEVDAEPASAR